ncbi:MULTISPECIES: hypothetical protein [unclassified Ensifer]|nr:hypothetical protein [Ensifer sp. Root558]
MVPVAEEIPVFVMPLSLDAPWWKSKEVSVPVISGGGALILTAIGGIPWQNLLIIIIIGPVGLARLPLLPEERRPEVFGEAGRGDSLISSRVSLAAGAAAGGPVVSAI